MVVIRVVQGLLLDILPTHPGMVSVALVLVFLIVVLFWGMRDGRDDAATNPDPDRRADLAMVWLLAGLITGVTSGAVTWLISLFDKALYAGSLLNEISTFAAFGALVVFIPAILGVTIGRWFVDRKRAKDPHAYKHHGLAAQQEGADTDVFAAVGGGEAPGSSNESTAAASAVTAGGAAGGPESARTEELPTQTQEAGDEGADDEPATGPVSSPEHGTAEPVDDDQQATEPAPAENTADDDTAAHRAADEQGEQGPAQS
jgi:hypothetical protein